jgi:hypothetical protein
MVLCFSCKKLGFDLRKLVSDRYICESCIDAECNFELSNQMQNVTVVDMSIKEFILKSNEHYKHNEAHQSVAKKTHLGIKLFNIKNEIADFEASIVNYEAFIKSKVDMVRFDVNQVYEFNLWKLTLIKTYYTNLLNNYEFELFGKLKKASISNLNAMTFNYFDLSYKTNEKNLKLFDKSYMLNELVKELEIVKFGSSFGSLDDALQKLKQIETKLGNYAVLVNNYMDEFYTKVHSNKFIMLNESLVKSGINKMIKNHLNIGCLKYENISKVESKDDPVLVDKGETVITQHSFEIASIHTIYDPVKNIENCILYYKSHKNSADAYKLEVYDQDGKLVKIMCINDKHIFALNSNHENVVICYTDKIQAQKCNIKLAVFNCDLKLVCSKSVENYVNLKKDDDESDTQIPVDLFVEAKRFYLLLANFDIKTTQVFAFNLTIDILNSFHLDKNQFLRRNSKMDVAYLRIFHADNKLFIKQKWLYGTRLDIVNSITGSYVDKLILNYNFDSFFINSNARYLNFMLEGKIYNYDLESKKLLDISYLNNHDKFIDKFCVSNQNTFNAIFTN